MVTAKEERPQRAPDGRVVVTQSPKPLGQPIVGDTIVEDVSAS